jgi:hypothetical protein
MVEDVQCESAKATREKLNYKCEGGNWLGCPLFYFHAAASSFRLAMRLVT